VEESLGDIKKKLAEIDFRLKDSTMSLDMLQRNFESTIPKNEDIGVILKQVLEEDSNERKELELSYKDKIEELEKENEKLVSASSTNQQENVDLRLKIKTATEEKEDIEKKWMELKQTNEELLKSTSEHFEEIISLFEHFSVNDDVRSFIAAEDGEKKLFGNVLKSLLLLEGLMETSKLKSEFPNKAKHVFSYEIEAHLLQVISRYVVKAFQQGQLSEEKLGSLIELINANVKTYEILPLKENAPLNDEIHVSVGSTDSACSVDKEGYYSLPVKLKDSPIGSTEVKRALVKAK
jgi:hypothetical protein